MPNDPLTEAIFWAQVIRDSERTVVCPPAWKADPPFPPDPWFEMTVRERLAREGVEEISDFEPEEDRVKLTSWYGLCSCGQPYRGRRSARIRDFDDTIELIEEPVCFSGHEMH